jgi:hypothetical protein
MFPAPIQFVGMLHHECPAVGTVPLFKGNLMRHFPESVYTPWEIFLLFAARNLGHRHFVFNHVRIVHNTKACPKVSGLTAWSENCKWHSSLPQGAVSQVSFAAITLCVASQRVFIVVRAYFVVTQSGNFWIQPRMSHYLSVKHI